MLLLSFYRITLLEELHLGIVFLISWQMVASTRHIQSSVQSSYHM